MIDRILDQWLQQQGRQQLFTGQGGHVNIQHQLFAEAQAFDAQVLGNQVELLAHRGQGFLRAKRRAEQIRQVLDCSLRVLGSLANQAGNGVHAVEQEMRPDACLQRIDLGLGCGMHALLPEFADIQVSQQRCRDQGADGRIAEHEAPSASAGSGQSVAEHMIHGINHGTAQSRRDHREQPGAGETAADGHSLQGLARGTQHHRIQECQPLHEHTGHRQFADPGARIAMRGHGDDQGHDLGHDHEREQGRQAAKLRQPVMLGRWARGLAHGAVTGQVIRIAGMLPCAQSVALARCAPIQLRRSRISSAQT